MEVFYSIGSSTYLRRRNHENESLISSASKTLPNYHYLNNENVILYALPLSLSLSILIIIIYLFY